MPGICGTDHCCSCTVCSSAARHQAYAGLFLNGNIGLMIAGIGVFSQLSIGATLVHMFNHALIKFVLFYIAGTIVQEYQTKI